MSLTQQAQYWPSIEPALGRGLLLTEIEADYYVGFTRSHIRLTCRLQGMRRLMNIHERDTITSSSHEL